MKKFISCTVILLVSCFVNAYDFESNGLYYDVKNSSECYVTYKNSSDEPSYSGEISIPSKVQYNEVEYNVTGIVYKAFYNCNELTSIYIPNSVTFLPGSLFSHCTNLTTVRLPENTTYIPNAAFYECTNLRNISIPQNVTKIEDLAFALCSSLNTIELPNGLTSIGGGVFRSCSSLKSIKIPMGIQTLKYGTFMSCSSLEEIQLNEGLEVIEGGAFYGCKSLKTIELPVSLANIYPSGGYSDAFVYCSSLEKIEVANGNKNYCSLNGVLMDYNQTTVVTCPEGYIGSFACPSSVIKLEINTFANCENLTEVILSKNITTIPANAFEDCRSLKSIILHEGITGINSSAFYGCSKLSEITFPSTLSTINSQAFYGCLELKSITSKAISVPQCSTDAFKNLTYDNCVLFVPNGMVSDYKNSDGWNNINYITDGNNPIYIESIKVIGNQYSINSGQQLQLSYSYKPEYATEKSVGWTSMNETIATVDETGLVTGKGLGSVEIKCYPLKGNGETGSFFVAIYGQKVTELSVSPGTIYLNAGNNGQVNINITPSNAYNKNLKITSSDKTVAYADGNVIYALKQGAAIITYETTDGSNLSAQVIVVASGTDGVEQINESDQNSINPVKVIINNQLLIRKKNKVYNLNGTIAK